MKTIADVFLSFLDQYGSPYIRSRVAKIRQYMNFPEWAEFFGTALLDACGYPTQIKESSVDKGIEFMIGLFTSDIEEKGYDNDTEHREKSYMHMFMTWYREALKRELARRGMLVKD